MKRCAWILGLLALASTAEARTVSYAIVIANNYSQDPGVEPLRYADDDGARNWELLSLFAEHASLFAVLDAETAELHPRAAERAEVPDRAAILDRLHQFDEKMTADLARGDEPQLYFVYAGHGAVDADGQGYVSLHDAKFSRRDLYREVIAPSHASFVHVVIDACNSYYLVSSRGTRTWHDDSVPPEQDRSSGQVAAYLSEEELEHYPRAGVIVATSGAGETHEWSRYRAGILSHELRSALAGAADINGDGLIEYSEVRAFVASANAKVSHPEAKLAVFAHAPAANRHRALVDLRAAARNNENTRFLHFGRSAQGQFHLEDDRGVRYVDFHKDESTAFDLVLPGNRTFYIRRNDLEEALLTTGADRRPDIARLHFHPRTIAARGALEDSFRADLFRASYGRGFYDGFVSTSGDVSVREGPVFALDRQRGYRQGLFVGYAFSGGPLPDAAFSHAAELRYAAQLVGPLVVGVAGEVGHGSGVDSSGFQTSLTRAALLASVGVEFGPRSWLSLGLEGALGWQLLTGQVRLNGLPMQGTEARGLRFEAAGAIGFAVHPRLRLGVRAGFALDATFPSGIARAVSPTGFLSVGGQLRM